MAWLRKILLTLISLGLVIADTFFFSFFQVHEASFLSSFAAVVIFALWGRTQDALIFFAAASLFVATFSSLPLWMIIVSYIIMPGLVLYFRRRHLPEPSVWVLCIILLAANTVLGLIVAFPGIPVSAGAVETLGWFILLNVSCGTLFAAFVNLIKRRLINREIKF